MKRFFLSLGLIFILLLSSCSVLQDDQDVVGRAGIPNPIPNNFFCAFALQDAKHQKLCEQGNNGAFDIDPDAQRRSETVSFFLKNRFVTDDTVQGLRSTERISSDGELVVKVFPDGTTAFVDGIILAATQTNGDNELLGDVVNTLQVIVKKPLPNPGIKFPIYRYGFYSTNNRVNGERTWRQFDLEGAMVASNVQKLNVFDSLLSPTDPNNPNNLWFDLSTSTTDVALDHVLTIDQSSLNTNEFALGPEETHVVLFMCTCTNCPNQAGWICSPRYLDPQTNAPRTFGQGDVRYALEKATVTNECTTCSVGSSLTIEEDCDPNDSNCRVAQITCGTGTIISEQACPHGCDKGRCLQAPVCGNGEIEFGESCDDGNQIDTDSCTNSCATPSCGDSICSTSESVNSCAQDCAVCGDNVCSPGETVNTCGQDCAICGDQICSAPTETDLNCAVDCVVCGDNICSQGENVNSCAADCNTCGDGIKFGNEECDDGNTDDGDQCTSQCTLPAIVTKTVKISDTSGGFPQNQLVEDSLFGFDVTTIGDVDNDGINDIAVGSDGGDPSNGRQGAVWVVLLTQDNTVKGAQKITENVGGFVDNFNDPDGEAFGDNVAALGDLNSDGVPDIVVGAPRYDEKTLNQNKGVLFVLFLDNGGKVLSQQVISENDGNAQGGGYPETSFNSFGLGVGTADLDSDGTKEVITTNGQRHLYVFSLNQDGKFTELKISTPGQGLPNSIVFGDRFGENIDEIGDVNKDGVVDLIIGAPGDDDGGTNRGAVYILFMDTDGSVKSSQKISDTQGGFTGDLDNNDDFGVSVAGIGDINGDTVPDVAVGAVYDDDGGSGAGATWILMLNELGEVNDFRKISKTQGGIGNQLDSQDNLGSGLALYGSQLIIGSRGDDGGKAGTSNDNKGAIYTVDLLQLSSLSYCGDGILQLGNAEACDDGNLLDADTCNNRCQKPDCGNFVIDQVLEECDYGTANGICSSSCTFEPLSSLKCEDSDNGAIDRVQGTTTLTFNNNQLDQKTDECIDLTRVREYDCGNVVNPGVAGHLGSKLLTCTQGTICQNGACVPN